MLANRRLKPVEYFHTGSIVAALLPRDWMIAEDFKLGQTQPWTA
jgi:hypothetical protein